MVYVDLETCGLHGVPVLIQYAFDNGPIILHEVWKESRESTMALIEEFCKHTVVGFNIAFDWFHIQKLYNMLEHTDKVDIKSMAAIEAQARDGSCVKPASALDLMLLLRKTELQITMERDDVIIRKVPKVVSDDLCEILNHTLKLDPILFAGYKKLAPKFRPQPILLENKSEHPYLTNIKLKFRPSSALKSLAKHVLGEKNVTLFKDIDIDKKFLPKDYGYAPFHSAVPENKRKGHYSWPSVLEYHIDHWAYRKDARLYAEKDIEYTRRLHEYAKWHPGGDTNSVLACQTASARCKGYAIDETKMKAIVEKYREQMTVPMYGKRAREYVHEVMSPIELAIVGDKLNKKTLEAIIDSGVNDEAAERAKNVMTSRKAAKKIELMNKLLIAGRFHASFKVMGALSDRMSGDNRLNPQGIDRTKEVRAAFPLAFWNELLAGGDMMSFEITIADAVYKDPDLRRQLQTCDKCGEVHSPVCEGADYRKFHGLFGMPFFNMTYDEILATKGTDDDKYTNAKTAAFATLYGALPPKIKDTLGITLEEAEKGFFKFWSTYKMAGKARQETQERFTSITDGFEFREACDNIESLLGHKRYFTLELKILKRLFEIASEPPKYWRENREKVVRSQKGEQTVSGATKSALFGSAFGMQAAMIRQASNHQIQSTGAGITKEVQIAIWELQPAGIHQWLVRPLNIHDEIQCPCKPGMQDQIKEVVYSKVESFRPLVPLIGIDFGELESWASK